MVREGRKEWGCKGEYASLAYLGIQYDTILWAYMLREVTVNSLGNPCSPDEEIKATVGRICRKVRF